jgi:hydrogenase maturation protease
VFDAIDFGLAPGTLRVLRNGEVPAWRARKISPHQTGFNDVLALAQLRNEAPEAITLIGVQPEELSDLGGSLRDSVKARIAEAVELGASELAAWGLPPQLREPGAPVIALNAVALTLDAYESGRPSSDEACRIGDARVLARTRM